MRKLAFLLRTRWQDPVWRKVEKAYPVTWNLEKGDWMRTTINLPNLVKEVFAPEGLTLHSLAGSRIRGKGKIAGITIF